MYEHEDGREYKFRRSIDPKGVCKYRVDGKVMSYEKYNDILKSIGVLVRAKNFLVFQGDVEGIAQKSPEELTALIEHISGSADLKDEFERLREEAEKAEEDFVAAFDKKRTMTKEKKQLKEQKEEAERFQNLLDEHKGLKVEFFLWQLYHVQQDLDANQSDMDGVQEVLDAKKKELEAVEAKLSEAGQEHAKERKAISAQEKQLTKETRALERRGPDQIKRSENIKHLKDTITSAEAKYRKQKKQVDEQNKKIRMLEKDLDDVKQQSQKLESESSEAQEFKLAASQIKEYQELKNQAGGLTAQLMQKVDATRRVIRTDQEAKSVLDSELGTLNKRAEDLEEKLKSANDRVKRLQQTEYESKAKLEKDQNKLEEITRNSKSNEERRKEVEAELNSISSRMDAARMDQRATAKELKMSECLESLKAHYPGVRGRLLDLCKPTKKKYNLAVTIAMGKNMDAIVVDEEKTAIECINYMKEQRIGVATFIPIDTVKTSPLNESYRQLGGSFKLIFDVVQCDPAHRRALLYSCGNTLVCDTLDEARKLAYTGKAQAEERKYKVVSLDGSVIHKSGNMTGGVGQYHQAASKWDDKDLAKVQGKRDELLKELAGLQESRRQEDQARQLQTAIKGMESRLKYVTADINETKVKHQKLEADLKEVRKQINKLEPEQAALQTALDKKEAELEKLESEVGKVENKVFAQFSKKIGVQNIREYEDTRQEQQQELLNRKVHLGNQESRLTAMLDFEKGRDMAKPLEQLAAKIQEDKERLKSYQQEETEAAAEFKEAKKKLEASTAEVKALREALDKKMSKYKGLKKNAQDLHKEIQHSEKQLAVKEGLVEKMNDVRKEIFRRCKLESVELPRTPSGKKTSRKRKSASSKRSSKRSPAKKKKKRRGADSDEEMEDEEEEEDEEEDEDEEEGEEEDFDVDFSMLEGVDHLQVKSVTEFTQAKQRYVDSIATMAADIDKLAPNLKAIERFKYAQDKLASTREEWEEKKVASVEAAEAFKLKHTERVNLFMKAYSHVADKIDHIYKMLTKSESFPMGGKASLSLENLDDPFLHGIKYTAMPPMKRFRDMDQLSGGEQTVAALALLFAIHSFHPAPFFVLDEVDAALDNLNVSKVSNYIRNCAHKDGLQCIVISLKDTFYTQADSLVGIYRDQGKQSSGALTMELTKFD